MSVKLAKKEYVDKLVRVKAVAFHTNKFIKIQTNQDKGVVIVALELNGATDSSGHVFDIVYYYGNKIMKVHHIASDILNYTIANTIISVECSTNYSYGFYIAI